MSTQSRVVTAPSRVAAGVGFRPILDVARGTVAGYQTVGSTLPAALRDGSAADDATVVTTALAALSTLPANTFITVPFSIGAGIDPEVVALLEHVGALSGIVLDLVDVPEDLDPTTQAVLDRLRAAGALVALGGDDAPQPPLRSVIRLRPSIIRLGRAWVDGIERSPEKRSVIEVTGNVASQLDAWVLAEGVCTAAELRTLSELGVPLAQGALVGGAHGVWQDVEQQAVNALPHRAADVSHDAVLRGLVRQAYTTRDVASARAVLPDTHGFEILVVVDADQRPTSLLAKDDHGEWSSRDALCVDIDTPASDAVARAMSRPRDTRFTPLVCTDARGALLGALHLEDLMTHLAARA